jgi:hypothetical protein
VCHGAEYRYAKCRSDECQSTECDGTKIFVPTLTSKPLLSSEQKYVLNFFETKKSSQFKKFF